MGDLQPEEVKEVYVDTKEPLEKRSADYKPTFDLIKKIFPTTELRNLDIGDIAWKHLRFELKTWTDFINALTESSGERFRNQLYNMYINPNLQCYYVIYGDWSEINRYSRINMKAVLGAIASIQARYDVVCNVFPNKEYAIYQISRLILKSAEAKAPKPLLHRASTESRAINVISCSAERLGERKALNLLEGLGTVRDIFNAEEKDLAAIKGIGPKTAKRIRRTATKKFR